MSDQSVINVCDSCGSIVLQLVGRIHGRGILANTVSFLGNLFVVRQNINDRAVPVM